MKACDCADFQFNGTACKHIYLSKGLYRNLLIFENMTSEIQSTGLPVIVKEASLSQGGQVVGFTNLTASIRTSRE
ncbi:hypothetical protein BDF20DRAFT_898755 [Mycotypha africana]|uniref:uncharacterized protein n=1 Tax=Mycotypha africana TaxID=64632 RepID=UPI0023006B44|nr:uncharacterized protein BDF20DRAFT_898755 [Mycotypha africana]KAI8967698.1 hypothetical protein BDF20DRAFT_898755 [Mycotypha africana]